MYYQPKNTPDLQEKFSEPLKDRRFQLQYDGKQIVKHPVILFTFAPWLHYKDCTVELEGTTCTCRLLRLVYFQLFQPCSLRTLLFSPQEYFVEGILSISCPFLTWQIDTGLRNVNYIIQPGLSRSAQTSKGLRLQRGIPSSQLFLGETSLFGSSS